MKKQKEMLIRIVSIILIATIAVALISAVISILIGTQYQDSVIIVAFATAAIIYLIYDQHKKEHQRKISLLNAIPLEIYQYALKATKGQKWGNGLAVNQQLSDIIMNASVDTNNYTAHILLGFNTVGRNPLTIAQEDTLRKAIQMDLDNLSKGHYGTFVKSPYYNGAKEWVEIEVWL